jgi:hypothetical protein
MISLLLLLAPIPADIGPAPERIAGIALVESAFRATLKDPDSAQFSWPNGFVAGRYRLLLEHTVKGWVTCGTVNAKNSYGGYVGRAAAVGVINNGVVTHVAMDDADAIDGELAEACKKMGIPAF